MVEFSICKIILFRYALNMDKVKTDRGFKAERNLDVKDDEFYDYVETSAYGELIRLEKPFVYITQNVSNLASSHRIFPHTKKVAKYGAKCALFGCGEVFEVGSTRILGATKFNDINLQFTKKINKFGKEAFHYICFKHLPNGEGYSTDEYESDV